MITQIGKSWFSERISNVPHSEEVKAYISGVYAKFSFSCEGDLSKDALLMKFVEAKSTSDFAALQTIGDWILWVDTFCKESIEDGQRKIVESTGRLSYYSCYRILNGKWQVFEELGDEFPKIVKNARIAFDLQPK